ncbi:winged helix-turn-helix transcriptional regulator [Nocardia sp. NPDC003345]
MTVAHTDVTDQADMDVEAGPCGGDHCGIKELLERLGDRWSLLVLVELHSGPRRFSDLLRAVPGLSQRMLTVCTRNLMRDGLISRTVYPTAPPQVEYALTSRSDGLAAAILAMAAWARDNHADIERCRAEFDAANP